MPGSTRARKHTLPTMRHARALAILLVVVAAGVRSTRARHCRDRGARPADGAVRVALGLCRRARLGEAARLAARAPALRADDPRLAGGGRGESPGEVAG